MDNTNLTGHTDLNDGNVHVVQKGETVWGILDDHNGSVNSATVNQWVDQYGEQSNVSDPNKIYPGQELYMGDFNKSDSQGDTLFQQEQKAQQANNIVDETPKTADKGSQVGTVSGAIGSAAGSTLAYSSGGGAPTNNIDYDPQEVIDACPAACDAVENLVNDINKLCRSLDACQDKFHCKGGDSSNALMKIYKGFSTAIGSSYGKSANGATGLGLLVVASAQTIDVMYNEAKSDLAAQHLQFDIK